MKICASYHTDAAQLDEVRYTAATLDYMVEKAIDVPDKTYILEILDYNKSGITKEKLDSLINELPNIVVDCYDMIDFLKLAVQHPNKVMYHYPCATFNDIRYVLHVKPYAVTIGEPLSFDLIRVRQMLRDTDVKVRVLPAIGRPSTWNIYKSEDNGINHFWITPNTLEYYEPYIDVIDLYDEDPEREKALVKIYKSGECDWPLAVLLKNCEASVGAYMIDDQWVMPRLECRQMCMQNKCHLCDRTAAAINTVLYEHVRKKEDHSES